jgi:hypothetical protein
MLVLMVWAMMKTPEESDETSEPGDSATSGLPQMQPDE